MTPDRRPRVWSTPLLFILLLAASAAGVPTSPLIIGGAAWAATGQTTTSPEGLPQGVTIVDTPVGPVYADAKEFTLYTLPTDYVPGKSSCTRAVPPKGSKGSFNDYPFELPENGMRKSCAEKWPLMPVDADAKLQGAWSAIDRGPDGWQLALNGKPLYRSVKDRVPGDVNGTYPVNVPWPAPEAARPPFVAPSGVKLLQARMGSLLGTADGVLFVNVHDRDGQSGCDAACMRVWRPFLSGVSVPSGDWSVVRNSSGDRQWAFRQQPVFIGPAAAGSAVMTASAVKGEWKPLIHQPTPPRPKDIQIRRILPGHVYTTAKGYTLYTFGCREWTVKVDGHALSCSDPGDARAYLNGVCGPPEVCTANWKPYRAFPGAKPVGQWRPVRAADPRLLIRPPEYKDSDLVWVYRGQPVYTYRLDKKPGDHEGHFLGQFGTAWFSAVYAFFDQDNL